MKKILLIITLIAVGNAAFVSASTSFNRRWGANSMIANLPLFFKPYQYEAYDNCHKSEFCKSRDCVRKKTVHKGTKGCADCDTPATLHKKTSDKTRTVTVTAQAKKRKQGTRVAIAKPQNTVAVNQKVARKETRKLANTQFNNMRQRQAKLELEKTKLQRELADLERKKQEFGLAKV